MIIVIKVDIRMFLEWDNNSGKLQIISGNFQNNAINDVKQILLSQVIRIFMIQFSKNLIEEEIFWKRTTKSWRKPDWFWNKSVFYLECKIILKKFMTKILMTHKLVVNANGTRMGKNQ